MSTDATVIVRGDRVDIPKKLYDSLTEEATFLRCLVACGVDNWCGYADAQEMMEENE